MAIYKKGALFHLVFAVVVVSVKTLAVDEISDRCPVRATTVRRASTGFQLKQFLYDRHVEYKPQAVILHRALNNTAGSQVDERAIIDVFVKYDVHSCQHIRNAYRQCYGEELLDRLKKKLNPKTRELISALISFWYDYYSEKLHEVISDVKTDDDTIIDIFSTQDTETIRYLKRAYRRAYNESLKSHVESATTGSFTRLLVSLLSMDSSAVRIDEERDTIQDARDLHNADAEGNFESLIDTIFTRPEPELSATIRQYERISHRSIDEKIRQYFSGSTEKLLLAIVQHVIKSDRDFHAMRLHAGVHGRMDYRVINMFFVNANKIDRQRYLKAFEKLYGKPFASFIPADSSDNYYYALRSLIEDALSAEED